MKCLWNKHTLNGFFSKLKYRKRLAAARMALENWNPKKPGREQKGSFPAATESLYGSHQGSNCWSLELGNSKLLLIKVTWHIVFCNYNLWINVQNLVILIFHKIFFKLVLLLVTLVCYGGTEILKYNESYGWWTSTTAFNYADSKISELVLEISSSMFYHIW